MAVKDKGAEMDLYEKLVNKEEKLALVGLGYVGMPIAVVTYSMW